MRVPLSWLKEFVEVPVEPRQLGEDLTLVGFALEAVETDGGDAVLDLEITTNRVDCMNVYGIAREVSALYGLPLRPLATSFREAGPPAAQALDVVIEAPDLCPRFCARVLDVRVGPSPPWIRERLEMVGVRPVNNVVDLTNYAMMEMGHPSHAFDLAKIPEGRLKVRWARRGERLTTLDGVARSLTARSGVVAGPAEPLALAGIMGGESSEVSEATRTVALEAAYWEPLAIRRAAKELGMRTEASHRFERGVDREGPVAATSRIAHLLERIGAGTTRPGLIDRYPAPRPRRTATLRPSRIRLVLGTDVPEEEAHGILRRLGFGIGGRQGEGSAIEIPTWRADVAREEDLIEEVGRHHGLDEIPLTLPPARDVGGLRPFQLRERALRQFLAGAGLTEVINYAFVADGSVGTLLPPRLRLANPLSEDQGVLRNSLVLPGLLTSLKTNLRHGRRDVRIFEVGRVFGPGPELPTEERRLGILLAGAARPSHWSEKPRPADVFDVKGLLEGLASRLGIRDFEVDPRRETPPFLHPGKCAAVLWDGEPVGYLGALHPDVAASWELRDEIVVAEVGLEAILSETRAPARFRPIERFPTVTRDLSVVLDHALSAAEIQGWIRAAAGQGLRSLLVADRYEGPPVPPGKVSLTLTLRYRDPARTLTGEEVQASIDRVIRELRARGAEIRGE